MVLCSVLAIGIDLCTAIIAFGLQPRVIMAALRPIPSPYHYKQSLTCKYRGKYRFPTQLFVQSWNIVLSGTQLQKRKF